MALMDLRSGCECCDGDLPPDADAAICTFECTYCRTCAEEMSWRCKNCGGNLVPRPIRPASLVETFPATAERVFNPSGCPVHDPDGNNAEAVCHQ